MSDKAGSQTSEDTTGQGDTSDDTDDTSSGSQGTNESQQDSTEGDVKGDTVSRDEFEAVKKRMAAADKRASELQKEKDEAARKDRSELENAQADLQKAQDRIAELERKLNDTAVQTAFVKYGKHDWVSVDDAIRLLDTEGVEVKDGDVSGLGPAIEKLVKDKPYLLKKNSDSQNDSSGASGSASNGRRKGTDDKKQRDMSSRFPALRPRASAQK